MVDSPDQRRELKNAVLKHTARLSNCDKTPFSQDEVKGSRSGNPVLGRVSET